MDPRHVDGLPENTEVLLITGPQRDYGEHTREQIRAYLATGGRLEVPGLCVAT